MSNHLFTADLHLGHEFVAKGRGFNSSVEHDDLIIGNLHDSLSKSDFLWILGDYSMSKHRYARELIRELPCAQVILIPGNHDTEHPMHRRARSVQRESMNVFDAVLPFARVRIQKVNFLMSHLPYLGGGDHKPEERHTEYRLSNQGMPLLCGHVHDAWRFNGNQFNVGVDVNDFRPVTSETVLEWHRETNS
ncbi:metallophosphoesterase [Brevibacterium sp. CSND-B09]|uniref:metallophosphoesterase n=1 Tax=Brevibacterium sp. CSND-B09 TaxID=3462571 RepID=UPI00406A2347